MKRQQDDQAKAQIERRQLGLGREAIIINEIADFIPKPLFLSSGHTSVRQRAIAVSSRCEPGSIGFCRFQSLSLSKRETGALYETLNSCAIILATLAQVHRSARKPYAPAPGDKKSGIRPSCESISLFGAPVLGRANKAGSPFSRAAFIHKLTNIFDTPKATAIVCYCHPCCFRAKPRRRRASFQSCGQVFVSAMPKFYHN
jgi:hypothetical protein